MTNSYERIQQYLDGDLKGKDLQEFESQLQADTALSEELDLMKEVRSSVALHQNIKEKEASLDKTLDGLGTTYFSEETEEEEVASKVRPIRRILAIAASILLLLSVLGFLYANQRFSAKALATSFLEKPLRDTDMGQVGGASILKEGKAAYFAQDYHKTKSLLQSITIDEGAVFDEAQLFLAYTAFAENQYKTAITNFSNLIEQTTRSIPNTDRNKLRWNRLLAYVGSGQTETDIFKQELAYFLNGKSVFYQQKAVTLQDALDSPWQLLIF